MPDAPALIHVQMDKSFCLSRHSHGSKSEAAECNQWLADKQSGKIKDYGLYPHFDLFVDGKRWRGGWTPDFWVIRNDGTYCVAESKGWNRSDDSFRIRLSIFIINHPEIPVYVNRELVRGNPFKKLLINMHKRAKKRLVRTYDRKAKRWVTVRADKLTGVKKRKN